MIPYKQRLKDFKESVLDEYLLQCTLLQRDFFKRLYPNGVNDGNIDRAIDQCERTVIKNKAKSNE